MDIIEINGEKYKKINSDGKRYVIARTYSAGVFAGFLEERKDKFVILSNARRLWYWSGAASLSELSQRGTSKPTECKFPMEVPLVELTECIEIIDVSETAKKSIRSVPIWTAHEGGE